MLSNSRRIGIILVALAVLAMWGFAYIYYVTGAGSFFNVFFFVGILGILLYIYMVIKYRYLRADLTKTKSLNNFLTFWNALAYHIVVISPFFDVSLGNLGGSPSTLAA